MLKKSSRQIIYGACILSFALSIGCGYQMMRSFPSWPKNIQKVYVTTFQNQTKEPGLEAIITDAFIKEFWHWNKVKVVNRPEAEAVLSGQITNYIADRPLSFDQYRNIREYGLSIHLDMQLKEASTEKIFWKKNDEIIEASYQYIKNNLAETKAEEKRAQIKAAQDLAKKLLDKNFTGF